MAFQKATVAFAGGIDESVHPRHLQLPRLKQCVNARFKRSGGLTKRPGNTQFSTVTATRLEAYRSESVAIGETYLSTYSAKTGAFEAKDRMPHAVPGLTGVSSSAGDMCQPTVGYSSSAGVVVAAWLDATSPATGNVKTSVFDSTTGAELQSSAYASGTAGGFYQPKVVAIGSTVLLLYSNNANVYARTLAADGKTWSSATAIVTDTTGDFSAGTNGTSLFVGYSSSSGAILKLKKFSAALALQASISSTEGSGLIGYVDIAVTAGEGVWATYFGTSPSNSIKAAHFTESLGSEDVAPFVIHTVSLGQTVLTNCVERVSSTVAVALVSYITSSGIDGRAVVAPTFNTSGSVVSLAAAKRTFWSQAASKPFDHGGRMYAWFYAGGARMTAPTPPTEQAKQYSLVLVDLLVDDTTSDICPAMPVTVEAPRYAYPPLDRPSEVFSVSGAASNHLSLARVLRSNNGRVGLVLLSANFDHPNIGQLATLGEAATLVPGSSYDGAMVSEISFCHWPQEIRATSWTTGGSLVAGSRYRWRICYVAIDSRGQIARSAPSDYTEETVPGGQSVAVLEYPLLSLTTRQDNDNDFASTLGIEIYRTTANPTDDTPYYLVFTSSPFYYNTPGVETDEYNDGASDASIAQEPQIYTQGGAKRRVQPPGFSCVVSYRSRIWGAHGNTLWYSGAFVEGEQPWFTDEFQQSLDTLDPITALWVMDDTLYISTSTRIYYLQADGPADNGAGNDIGSPLRVATDLGCIEPRSIIVTPLGTLYQSAVGIQLMDRTRQVPPTIFGRRVQTTLESYPTIVAAVVHPTGGNVLFFCTNGATSRRLIYDYAADEWAVDSASIFGAFKSASIVQGVLNWINATTAYFETGYLDAGLWVTRTVEFEFHPVGIQEAMMFHKLTLQAEKTTSHGISVAFAKDFSGSVFDTLAYSDAAIDALGLEQMSFAPGNGTSMRCSSMSVTITDTTPTTGSLGTGQGCELVSATLEFNPLGHTVTLPSGAKK